MRSSRGEVSVSDCQSKCCNIPEPEFLIESMDTEKETFQLKGHLFRSEKAVFQLKSLTFSGYTPCF